MKGKKKKFLGLLGLFLVVATTTFAALIPLPGANAEGRECVGACLESSATDEVVVRVVGNKPLVRFTSPQSGLLTKEPNINLGLDYENVDEVWVEVEYTDLNGQTHKTELDRFKIGLDEPISGHRDYSMNLDEYGHGDFKVTVHGAANGVETAPADTIEFTYTTHTGGAWQDPETGKVVVDPGVEPDDRRVDHVEANVYDEDGNLVDELSPTEFKEPFDPQELDFSKHDLPSGWYTVEIIQYDQYGDQVGQPRYFTFWYERPEIAVPNTGDFFAGLNISRTDYLLTGLIVFGLAAGLGLFFVVRGRKEKAKAMRSKKRR